MMLRFLLSFVVVCVILRGIEAQEACVTPNNANGACINIRECPALIEILKRPRPLSTTDLNFVRNSQCGFEGTYPKVCCETQITQTETTPPPPPDVTNHPNLNLLNHDICGPITQGKIIGGNKTRVFEFPWMALIAYNTGRSNDPEFRCGGTIINQKYILTAAHCVTSLPPGLRLIGVRVGEHNISSERDCDRDKNGFELACAERYQDFGVESTHFHPLYTRAKLQNDIGLIRISGEASFRPKNVKPICLPIGTAASIIQKKVTVTGWGATEDGPRSADLLKINIPQVPDSECKEVYKRNAQIWYKQMCAGGKKNADSCPGDSGGPLQAPGLYNNNLRFVQYGIVSFGLRNCGTEGFPGVYTRITYYMDWILNTMRP